MENNVAKILGTGRVTKGEDISKLISSQGVVVSISSGGGRNAYYITPKVFGVNTEHLSDDSADFMQKHVKNGRISFLPKNYEAEVHRIVERTRKRLRETAIGYNGTFVPLSMYPELRAEFEKDRAEFLALRDKLGEEYDSIKARFINVARKMLSEMNAREGEAEIEEILSRLPSRNRFVESFHMEMEVSAFPTEDNLDMFSEDIQEQIRSTRKSGTDGLVRDSIVACLDEGIVSLSKIVKNTMEGKDTHPKTMSGLKNSAERIKQKNIFGNAILDEFAKDICILVQMNAEDAESEAERLLAAFYHYATEVEVEHEVNLAACPVLPGELIRIHKLYS